MSNAPPIKTVEGVIEALAGDAEGAWKAKDAAAAAILGAKLDAVQKWRTKRAIPAIQFLVVQAALGRVGRTAAESVFTFHRADVAA